MLLYTVYAVSMREDHSIVITRVKVREKPKKGCDVAVVEGKNHGVTVNVKSGFWFKDFDKAVAFAGRQRHIIDPGYRDHELGTDDDPAPTPEVQRQGIRRLKSAE